MVVNDTHYQLARYLLFQLPFKEVPFLKCVGSIWTLPNSLDPPSVKRANVKKSAPNYLGKPLHSQTNVGKKSAPNHPGKPLHPTPLLGNAHWKQHI